MLEVTRRFTIKTGYGLYTQLFQQLRQDDATYRVHCVESHTELAGLNSLDVHKCQVLDQIDVFLVIATVFTVLAEVVNIGIFEVLSSSNAQHFCTFGSIQELTIAIQQF